MPLGRQPDKPGTYRVVRRGGTFMLSGVRWNGSRVKVRELTRQEAERMGREIFGGGTPVVNPVAGPVITKPEDAPIIDDWGLPIRVSSDQAASLNASLGITPQPPPGTTVDPMEEERKKLKRTKDAKSLMELAGVTWAMGSVWAGRKLCERTGREAPTPDKGQVNDLRDVTRDTLTEWFGDHEVKPWQMMILLSLGIPFSMFLQARRLPQAEVDKSKLKSVP